MPGADWATIGTIAGAAAQVGGQVYNVAAQGKTNLRTRQFADNMYSRQRQDALSDYQMQNDYNSPTSQMKRLREAGLNPNLVYGNGNTSTAAATVKSSTAPSWQPHAPQVDPGSIGNTVRDYFDTKVKQQTIDNLKAQNTNIVEDTVLKQSQSYATLKAAGKTDAEIATLQFELGQKNRMADTQFSSAQANLEKTKSEVEKIQADKNYTINQDERAAIQTTTSVQEAAVRILKMRAETSKIPSEKAEIQARIKNIEADTKIKTADGELKNKGVQPHDALWQRTLMDILGWESSNAKDAKGNTTPKAAAWKYAPWKPF